MKSEPLSRRAFLRVAGATGATALLAACVQPAAPTSPPAATQAPAATEAAAETKAPAAEAKMSSQADHVIQFSYFRPVWGPATHQKGSAYELELFKQANVQIESQIVPVFDIEAKFPVLVAGGTFADMMWYGGPNWGPGFDLIQQGAFLPLDDLLDKYPDVKNAVSDGLWDMVKSPDGKHYFFPNSLSPWVPFPIYYRSDIFKELNIAEPTTTDELLTALKTIKAQKPDMVPLTTHEYSLWYFQNTAVAFGYGFGNWTADPEDPNPANPAKIVPSQITQPYKDFLAWLQMLRKEGLIDPDYLVAQGKKGVDKFNSGQAAVMAAHWMGLPDWIPELRKSVPDADVAYMPPLKGPAGPMGCVLLSGYDRGFSIASAAKDKADDIFKFLSWVYSEGYDFMSYGVEGKTYKVDADGNKISIPDTEREKGWTGDQIEPFGFPPKSADVTPGYHQTWYDIYALYKARGLEDKMPMVRKMYEDMAANAFPDYSRGAYSPTGGKKGTQLWQQYIKPMEEKIAIDPTVSLDTWDENIKLWLENGGNDIIKEVNDVVKDKSRPNVKYEYTGKDYK